MSSDKINVLYHPDFTSETTLKKAILFFDEIHFIDRPSLTTNNNFGTIGARSPMRKFEKSFRDEGIPIYVQDVQSGRISDDLESQLYSDMNDPLFLEKFITSLKSSPTFKDHVIPRGNYSSVGSDEDVLNNLLKINIPSCIASCGPPEKIWKDNNIKPMDFSNEAGALKTLLLFAQATSLKLTYGLMLCSQNNFIPLADSLAYNDLLNTRYIRAISKFNSKINDLTIADLSFAIFNSLVSTETIESISLQDVIKYRKASDGPRREFMMALNQFQLNLESISIQEDSETAINKLIKSDVEPSIKKYKDALHKISDNFIASITKRLLASVSGGGTLSVFMDLSWSKILSSTVIIGASAVGLATVDAFKEKRAAKRENSISYVLELDG